MFSAAKTYFKVPDMVTVRPREPEGPVSYDWPKVALFGHKILFNPESSDLVEDC